MRADRRALGALTLALALTFAGCAGGGPPRIATGTTCDGCGMSIADLRFACERRVDHKWRRYDSIECLLGDVNGDAGHEAWLADYDSRTLHAADSMWVVRGNFPSPMGGGYAAFLARPAADDIAARTDGRVARLDGLADAVGAP